MSPTTLSELEWLAPEYGLTSREIEVLRLVLSGRPSKSIAFELGLCIPTVEVHRANIRKKLGVSNTASIFQAVVRGPRGRPVEDAARPVAPVAPVAQEGPPPEVPTDIAAEDADGHAAKMYGVLVDAIPGHAIYLLSPAGLVLSWNAGAEKLKGYQAREIVGQHFSKFYVEEDRLAGLPEQALRIADKAGRYEGEGWRVKKDGSRFWATVMIQPIRRLSGELIGFGKMIRHEPKNEAVAEAHRGADKFRQMVQGVVDYAIYTLDPLGLIKSWNAGAERMTGYTLGRAIGLNFSTFYPKSDRESGIPQASLEAATRLGSYEAEIWQVQENGKPFRAHVIIDAIRDDRGVLVGFVEVARETDDKRWSAALQTSLRRCGLDSPVGATCIANDFSAHLY